MEQREPPVPVNKPVDLPSTHQRGRPKGSKNHHKPVPELTPDLTLLQRMSRTITIRIAPLTVKHVVLDRHFGNYPATWAGRETSLHIISKLRHDAALYLPYTGPKPARGASPRYGDKLSDDQLPAETLGHSSIDGDYRIDTYQAMSFHKSFSDALNVVVVVKTHRKTCKRGHVVLFSTDLDLSLDDFMNVKSVAVTNAVNLAFLMVNLSAVLLKPYRDNQPDFSVLDLKAQFRARRYLDET